MNLKILKILKNRSILFIQIVFYLITPPLIAQEYLTEKMYNEILINNHKPSLKSSLIPDTLELPFLDDFSKPNIYPDPLLWADNEVYINYTRAINSPSVGVATFDMFNHNGKIHENSSLTVFIADSLTSKPINLEYPIDSNIYLSFAYQCGGIGDIPEIKDSLFIEFYSPSIDKWDLVYSIPGGGEPEIFRTAIIPVNQDIYLKKGFRFKIKNFASFEENSFNPYRKRDGDHWHIDFVYLDMHRSATDTIIEDIAFTQIFWPILEEYTAIPWNHCNSNIIFKNRKKTLDFVCLNTRNEQSNVAMSFRITDLLGNADPFSYSILDQNAEPFNLITFPLSYNYSFSSNSINSAEFKLQSILYSNIEVDKKTALLQQNDTLTFIQKFESFYSYDDGSAEYGYGISDEGADNARIALQYICLEKDTLYGVNICFLKYELPPDISVLNFNLGVWNCKNGLPDDLIYSKQYEIEYPDGLNLFNYYPVDSPLIIADTFYVGIIQKQDAFLNIGFDANTNSKKRIFYNLDGSWQNSIFDGSLMIRPDFSINTITSIKEVLGSPFELVLYPNPASQILHILLNDINSLQNIYIFNSMGFLVQKINNPLNTIDISHLPTGIYFLRFNLRNGISKTQKLLIQR